MLDKLAGIHYWITIIDLILAGIMIAAPLVILVIVKIMDGMDELKGKMRRRKKEREAAWAAHSMVREARERSEE